MGNSGYQPAGAEQLILMIFTLFTLMTHDFGTGYGKAMDRMTNYAGMVSN